jgi:hypothetical protein
MGASGLRRLVEGLHGGEVVYAGGAPALDLDAAQRLQLLAYPILLGRALRAKGTEPGLRLTYLIQDWASDQVESISPQRPLNLVPHGRTYQHQPDPLDGLASRANRMEAALQAELDAVQREMPQANIQVVRASGLKSSPDFRAVLRVALRSPRMIREALQEALPDSEIADAPLQFAGPVCRRCHSIEGRMEYVEGWDRIQFQCASCGNGQEADIREQDYWMHEWVLEAAARAALRPDVVVISSAGEVREAAVSAILARTLKEPSAIRGVLVTPDIPRLAKDAPLETLLDLAGEGQERGAQ